MSVVLVTGASTGIGNLTVKELAAAGHTVYASMRDPEGRNRARAGELLALAERDHTDLRVVELDVRSQESADAAVQTVLAEAGQLDVVVHNAGHLALGYTEAFTAEEVADMFDVNAISVQRVNRAALPHLRARRSGTLLYVGSTTTVSVPPFLGPYVASKFAFDALAQVTSYEVSQFGIETVIVMPGAFTVGTSHFANASGARDEAVSAAYAELDPLVDGYGEATEGLFEPGVDAHPVSVAREITRILALPVGEKPFRSVIDFTRSNVDEVNTVNRASSADFLTRMGMGSLLEVKR
ncbi:short-chain dehydrogenase/reductase [Streptomyces spiralis]|uniref:Short-chain dehydrogenase/reductase n=1 Tax=Streptomyces spiralis TaxID=66376 RepID=A0A919E4E1_9ACTN|nr:SDR family oxidoreductase [Streptomyces spiralis]GHF12429.1 short-chain dehydrogenase/reductase [Streptomyces spiralis]